jgi:hypothetical protein
VRFRLLYPTNVLKLSSVAAITTGELIPSTALVASNSENVTNAWGEVVVAASSAASWNTGLSGSLARFNFELQGDTTPANATIVLESIEVTADGFGVEMLSSVHADIPEVTPAVSPRVELLGFTLFGSVHLRITGTGAEVLDVMASNDLNSWTKVGSVTLSNGAAPFTDSPPASTTRRYYRLRTNMR